MENDLTKIYGNPHVGQPPFWDKNELFRSEKFETLDMDEFLASTGVDESDVAFLQKLENSDLGSEIAQHQQQSNSQQPQQNLNMNSQQQQLQAPNRIQSVQTPRSAININNSQIQQQQQQQPSLNQNIVPSQTFQLRSVSSVASTSSASPKNSACNSPNKYASSNASNDFDYNDLDSIDSMDLETYNPKMRKFGEDELKPTPMLKKSKKVNVLIDFNFLFTSTEVAYRIF
jgi:hypothetical protein